MGFKKFFGKLFGVAQVVAPIAAGAFFPAFAPLINSTLRAIIMAEGMFPAAKSGPDKALWVSNVVAVNAPDVIEAIEKATGKELSDQVLLQEALADINNGLVKAMNAFKVLPKA